MRPVEAWSELSSQLFECVDTEACEARGDASSRPVRRPRRQPQTHSSRRTNEKRNTNSGAFSALRPWMKVRRQASRCSKRTSNAGARPLHPKTPSPRRGAFAWTAGALHVLRRARLSHRAHLLEQFLQQDVRKRIDRRWHASSSPGPARAWAPPPHPDRSRSAGRNL